MTNIPSKADLLAAAATVTAFANSLPDPQPAPAPAPDPAPAPAPPPSGGGTVPATPIDRTMFPDKPLPPKGPFTEKQQFKVTAPTKTLDLKGLHFADDYTAVQIGAQVEQLNMSDCVGDNVGSFIYTTAGAGGVTNALIERVLGHKQKAGRPAFRIYGPAEVLEFNDIDITFDGVNTDTGNIGTGFQLAEKFTDYKLPDGSPDQAKIDADKAAKLIKLIRGTRIEISQILTKWPSTKYYNGDGDTVEESAERVEFGHLYMHDITDGGVDFKAPGTIEFLRSERCRAGAKLWASMHIKRFICLDPTLQGGIGGLSVLRVQGHKANPPVIQIDNSYVHSDSLLIDIENGPVELHVTGKVEGTGALVPKLNNGGLLLPNSTLNGSAFPKK